MTSTGSSFSTASARRGRLDLRRSARVREGRRSRLTVYLAPEERQALELRAQSTGESMAKILVDSALHPMIADADAVVSLTEAAGLLRDYRRQLVGVTTNLNQIAHHANTVHEVPADFGRVVAEVERLTDEINDLLVSVRR